MLVQFSEAKWNDMIASGKTLGELIHENDARLRGSLDVEFNKKNRVTVAQFASKEAIANTPRSPQFKSSVPQNPDSVNTSDKFSFSERTDNAIDNRTLLANAFESVAQNDVERSWLLKYKLQIVKLNEDQNKLGLEKLAKYRKERAESKAFAARAG